MMDRQAGRRCGSVLVGGYVLYGTRNSISNSEIAVRLELKSIQFVLSFFEALSVHHSLWFHGLGWELLLHFTTGFYMTELGFWCKGVFGWRNGERG